jgi:hypothetical protein
MSRIKPYKSKRRIADFKALEYARSEAVERYRTGLMELFDRHQPREPIQWTPGPGAFHTIKVLMGQIEKAQYTVMVEDEPRPGTQSRSGFLVEHARRGAALKIAQYLMHEGFIQETNDQVHGIGHRLTFTIFAAKVSA